jgi:hypothetical protein
MERRRSTKGTASAVPKQPLLMRALAPEVRFSVIAHAQSLGNSGKKAYLSG